MQFERSNSKLPLKYHETKGTEPKTVTEIDTELKKMDTLYSAVFSEWIKDQNNLPVAVTHFSKIANQYPLKQIILVVKWLVAGWKLKSDILLITNLTAGWKSEIDLAHLIKEVAGRWKAPYIAELSAAIMDRWDNSASCLKVSSSLGNERFQDDAFIKKKQFLATLMEGWHFNQVNTFFFYLGSKVEWDIKHAVYLHFHQLETSLGLKKFEANLPISPGSYFLSSFVSKPYRMIQCENSIARPQKKKRQELEK